MKSELEERSFISQEIQKAASRVARNEALILAEKENLQRLQENGKLKPMDDDIDEFVQMRLDNTLILYYIII